MSLADGIYPSLSRERYDAIERVNNSTLKAFASSAAHYSHGLVTPYEDTDAKKVGRCTHLATFEPDRFRASIAVWDGGTRRGKDWDSFRHRNEGKELLTEAEFEKVSDMTKAVRSDVTAQRYLTNGEGEQTILWTVDVNGVAVACKGRVDFTSDLAIVDLKTTKDASPEGFARQAWQMRHHTQAAWYSDGFTRATAISLPYYLVAVENTPPHIVQVYRVPDALLELGREEYRAWLERLVACRASKKWPGYHDGELELTLPKWATPYDDEDDLSGLTFGGAGVDLVTPAN